MSNIFLIALAMLNTSVIKEKITSAKTIEVEEFPSSKVLTGSGRELSTPQVTELKKLLSKDALYQNDLMKSCLFVPKTAIHFKKEEEITTILYSPWCKQIKVIDNDGQTIVEVDGIADALEALISAEEK